ncbi:DUF3139 domain-containing protein [Staphylococcus sp. SQ8-PEA]|uniref:DUF3139 domain-containing protein n=1 Tax=Staphylococcus marylandisciuri TaxID=2981529 RepID=A0ABT2QS81_9STAP|nr:DUF3139 domain-containing protein [Staphylococcus marylandisciuri]MCU5746825.1 DUF3139 domain-containing protein [Staphylococcus marylandisciuri]
MNKKFKIIGIVIITLIIILIVAFIICKHMYLDYQKHEEAKLRHKVHHVFKQKGWEDKIKDEENIFTLNTGDNDLQVTFKDEPYNTYTYSVDEDNKVRGDAVLKDKYDKDFESKKKYKEYLKRIHFKETYDLK